MEKLICVQVDYHCDYPRKELHGPFKSEVLAEEYITYLRDENSKGKLYKFGGARLYIVEIHKPWK